MRSMASSQAVNRIGMVLTIALSMMVIVGAAAAHGGGTMQLSSEAAGPYLLTVWTSPEPAREGELHLTIGVGTAYSATVLDAHVEVEIANQALGRFLSGVATSEQSANKFLYEVDMELPDLGLYMVTVMVTADAGYGSASFELEVLPANSYEWVVVMLVSACAAVSAAWLVFRR